MSSEAHIFLWSFERQEGHEHVRLMASSHGVDADGVMIFRNARCRYIVSADARWHTRTVTIDPLDGRPVRILITDGQGRWFDANGKNMADLDGCIDVDIEASCFTNTLPIRRLALKPGVSVEIRAAFVALFDLTVRTAMQRYTLVDREGSDGLLRVRYEGLESGFSAELSVDGEGMVVRYPGLATRA